MTEYWKTRHGEVYEPSNRLTQDDCWQAYEAMDAGERLWYEPVSRTYRVMRYEDELMEVVR